MTTTDITGTGTDEAEWIPWLQSLTAPDLTIPSTIDRVVVVAAHPDDEVLGCGGLLSQLAQRSPIVVIWATDGEASHPNSTRITPEALAGRRRDESRLALARLGVEPIGAHHLALPDSGLAAVAERLDVALRELIQPDDLVICNWSGDGHPDHEAVGRAVDSLDVRSWQLPIWMWHWAHPGDDRVSWQDLRRVRHIPVDIKTAAIDAFETQIHPLGPDPSDAAVLPPEVIARFVRDDEWLLV